MTYLFNHQTFNLIVRAAAPRNSLDSDISPITPLIFMGVKKLENGHDFRPQSYLMRRI